MGFLFNLFFIFTFFGEEGRLSLSQNIFSQLSETSVRCLDPSSGEEISDEKVELGVSCIAEVKSEKGMVWFSKYADYHILACNVCLSCGDRLLSFCYCCSPIILCLTFSFSFDLCLGLSLSVVWKWSFR